ncbi:MAG: NAD(P)/FAD-dependent oxidoreductase [Salipiger thiooxidans]|uniref:NAD(P)/FAD-dependent oxidoreductase n=1 Tax=Salipiger thiooxidans TaxID=282683 RepID=UPI001CFA21D5|nr:FAD-binding oxidoreductase [Salipiger thiooxidans]
MTTLPQSAEVIVVGGGIVGLSVALALAEAGAKPLLLEAKSFGGAVTGGSLAAIGTHMHGLTEYGVMAHACDLWRAFAERTGNPFEHTAQGQVGFILDAEGMESGEGWVAEERARGAPCRMLTPAELAEVEPRLTGPVLGATFAPDTATVNPFLAARTVLAEARAAGAVALDHAPVAGLRVEAGRIAGVRMADGAEIRAGQVVLASGPWSQEIGAGVGVSLPLVPRQAQCLAALRQPAGTIRRLVSAVESRGGVASGYTQIQQAGSGQILFNTVVDFIETPPEAKDTVREVPSGFVLTSIDTLAMLFPSLAEIPLLRSWVRFEAVSPDARFLAGPVGPEGLWVCAGDNGSGYCRALMLGRFLAGEITGGTPLPGALQADARALYAPQRFAQEAA